MVSRLAGVASLRWGVAIGTRPRRLPTAIEQRVQAIGRQPHRAPDGAPFHYERRRPEQTTLYRLVQQHAETFFAEVEAATGASLPHFVKDEFDAFLECGILAHGFLRLRCADCGHDKLVAFSCKRRGFCPSCGARRMAQSAAHLVDHVIAQAPVRQWVLSLPIPLRLLLAAQPQLLTPVLQVVHRVLTGFLLEQAGLKAGQADSGAVTLIQRFGSAANLNIHLHCLVLAGVYRRTEGRPVFVEARAPNDEALQAVLHKIIGRILKLLTRRALWSKSRARPTWLTAMPIRTTPARSGRCKPQPVTTASP